MHLINVYPRAHLASEAFETVGRRELVEGSKLQMILVYDLGDTLRSWIQG